MAVKRPRVPSARPAPAWRRFVPTRGQVLLGILGTIVLGGLFLVIGYATTTIPSPNGIALAQTTLVYAADGHTVLGRIGVVNRVDVPLDEVPLPVQRTVLAAEDRHYYSEPGISVPGMLRALAVDVTGGSVQQGGSTITQQYAKNAYLTQARTFSRKIREIFLAVKLDHTQSKATVLQNYLNTIYFGRGAYGIEAASLAYFGRGVSHLDVAQGAVLAGAIDAPSLFDPYVDPSAAKARWSYVINGMVRMGWLSAAQAADLRYPHVLPPSSAQVGRGPDGFIVDAVKRELAAHGMSEAQLTLGGYRVITTINAVAQHAAEVAEAQLQAQVPGPVSALVAVQPGDGAIRAYYGGRAYDDPKVPGSFLDLVRAHVQPGSSFKPYTLITALGQHIGLNTLFNGSSPQTLPGYPVPLYNSNNEQCVPCTLTEATARSINTVYVPLALKVGPANVRATAHAAGVDEPLADSSGFTGAGIGIGIYPVTPLDQATGYATIAANGIRATPYLVAKVLSPSGQVVYQAHRHLKRVFSEAVTSDATYALEQVLDNPLGTAYGKGLANRPAAGKTGTATNPHNQNTNDWFVGYTPQLAAAVWLGNLNGAPILGPAGYGEVFGGGPPASAWQTFMNLALAGAPVLQFPPPAQISGNPFTNYTPSPTPSRSPSPSPSPTATRSPSPRPSPSSLPPLPTPSPSPSRSSPGPTPPTNSPSP
jgi:membrane peptidoglycan carboxypeptidase